MMGRSPDLAQNPIVKVYCSQMVGRSDWICPRKRLKQVSRPPGGTMGALLGPLGALGGPLGAIRGPLGGFRGCLGAPGGPQGAGGPPLGPRGALVGPLGAPTTTITTGVGGAGGRAGQARQAGRWRASSQTRVTSGKSSKIQRS